MTIPSEIAVGDALPGGLLADTRPGRRGYIVPPDQLLEVATQLRDKAGYAYLSSATAVDYPAENALEMVYHLYRLDGSPALVLHSQTPRENPTLPSLVPIFPGADFQEREAWDLMGVRFAGHPDLRRILLWEGFAGHPLRKDWHEPYFEAETKPFASRWPNGTASRCEQRHPFGRNIQLPPGFSIDDWTPATDDAVYAGLVCDPVPTAGEPLTDHILLNMGPHHPSTHGVFRMAVALDGETIIGLRPVFGYLHRCHEKIGERNTFLQNMPFTDRLDYITSLSNNLGYALAVEQLMGIRPPERAEYIRVMLVEFTRIVSHLIAIGFLLNDLGAYFTPVLYALNERERILDLFEAVTGSRMMCNFMRFGGIARDLPDGTLEFARELVFDRLPRQIDELDAYLTTNEIIQMRSVDVGKISAGEAIAHSLSGPVLRACGVAYDLRRADPYSIYDRLAFDIPVQTNGDVFARYLVRLAEMRESLKILRQVIDQMPGGEIMTGKPQPLVKVPPGEAYGRVEGPKGDLGFYVISDGKPNPYRYHIRPPTLINLTALGKMCCGHKLADVVVILGSIDITLGEIDR
jgi:NADH-quinone oxidoreductase subunit C/D